MQIVKEEKTIRNLNLIVVFHRGLLYLSVRNLAPVGVNIKDWFRKDFGVNYMVALRYQALASLILRYPRLIVCGLTFTQVVKHKDHIMVYLKDDIELAAQLSVAVNICAQNKPVDIYASECPVPKGKFSVDPDYIYEEDYFSDPAGDDIPVDPYWEAQIEEAHRDGKLLDIIYGDEQAANEENLEAIIEEMAQLKPSVDD